MMLRNMLKICLVFWESEPQYAYKRYAYKKKTCSRFKVLSKNEIELYARKGKTISFFPCLFKEDDMICLLEPHAKVKA